MDLRRGWLVGIAFLVGLALGAFLLLDAGPLSLAGASPLAIEVLNAGPRAATGDLSVRVVNGATVETWALDLPVGQSVARELPSPPSGQLAVRLSAAWEAAADGGRGETTTLVRPSECPGGEPLVVRFSLDTSRGVSFGRTTATCGS